MFKLQDDATDGNAAAKRTVKLYEGLGWKSLFARIRFWDAPYTELESLVPKEGTIVDLGCGDGMFTNFLAIASGDREVFGLELNKERFKGARRGLHNTKFVNADITKSSIPQADAIVLVHVLHHLTSFRKQEELIEKCYHKLRKSGKLIIAEVEPKPSLKFLAAWLTDHFVVPIVFERKLFSHIFFRRSHEWQRLLVSCGFSCKTIQAEAGKPFTHIILECRKK